ncbi:histidine kinase sensor domain-containing protein [Pseudomonas sp. LRF_L74]|uniref:sensor histidine kinase n=1 Tax=Pseudomonas sp. LRF_L74 TaxID=3369422 RepID=UPI003F643759
MLARYSLFWRLAALLLGVCLLIAWGTWYWSNLLQQNGSLLSRDARQQLHAYAAQAEQAWSSGGREGVERWLGQMAEREPDSWLAVTSRDMHSLGTRDLTPKDFERIRMLRSPDGLMSVRAKGLLYLNVPFPREPGSGQLLIQLPKRFVPEGFGRASQLLIHGLAPGVLALLLCVLIYRQLVAPLNHLRERADAWRADRLDTRVSPAFSRRRDELGELGRAFDHMAERLQHTVSHQRQLLRDLSHELRTPLSRLRVAGECATDLEALRQRLEREVQGMQQLVDDTLELVWLDTERPQPELEEIDVPALWGVLGENACFESGWSAQRLRCELPADCRVRGHLNGLAQALENILRNAIRHSPAGGWVRLGGERVGSHWHLHLEDQGGGVEPQQLETIFRPFTRLSAARPGGEGYGLGLAIARGAVRMQGGELWAENGQDGLRLNLRLASV